jgi:hypothetical protein
MVAFFHTHTHTHTHIDTDEARAHAEAAVREAQHAYVAAYIGAKKDPREAGTLAREELLRQGINVTETLEVILCLSFSRA